MMYYVFAFGLGVVCGVFYMTKEILRYIDEKIEEDLQDL